jgi:hypothetical protein
MRLIVTVLPVAFAIVIIAFFYLNPDPPPCATLKASPASDWVPKDKGCVP